MKNNTPLSVAFALLWLIFSGAASASTHGNAPSITDTESSVTSVCDPVDYTYAHVICAGETYPFGELLLSITGDYQRVETKQDGCDSVINLFLAVIPRSQPVTFELVSGSAQSFSANGAQTCVSSGPLTFAASVFGGTWVGDNVDETGTYQPTQVGNFQIGYQYTNDNGCMQTDYLGIEVIDVVPVDAGGDFSITYDSGPVELNAVQPSGGTWSGPGVSGNTFDPKTAGTGTFMLYYSTPDCGGTDGIEVTVDKGSQVIFFYELEAKKYGDPPFFLEASITSELGIFYASSDQTVATISGSQVTIVGVGSTTITASQPGNEFYHAAAEHTSSLIVNKGDQSILFDEITAKLATDESFDLTATSSASLPLQYSSSNTDVVTIVGSTALIHGSGTVTITATQSGNNLYNAASDASRTFDVNKADQTINFPSLSARTLGDVPFTPSATATSGAAVVLTSSSDKITLTNNEVTLLKAGRATITAAQPGNNIYNSAAPVDQSFCINPAKPSITMPASGLTIASSSSEGNQWFKDGVAMPGKIQAELTVEEPGSYQVQVTINDCVSELSIAVIMVVTSSDVAANREILLFPNPASGQFTILGIEGDLLHSEVIDLVGRTVALPLQKTDDQYSGDAGELRQGQYLLSIVTATRSYRTRLVKQ